MAIYIFDIASFTIRKLIAMQGRSIVSFSWSPADSNMLASACGDGAVLLWNICDECVTNEVSLGVGIIPGPIDWCPKDPNRMAILATSGDVYLWSTNEPEKAYRVKQIYKGGDATAIRFCQHGSSNRLAIGTRSGRILLLNIGDNQRPLSMPVPTDLRDGAIVTDLRWDPRSSAYVLALYSDGRLVLIDTESVQIAVEFESQKRTTAIAWDPFVPGQFFTINSLRASLDVWNVSQKTMQNRHKLGENAAGSLTMEVSLHAPLVFVSLSDGSVVIFNSKTKRTQFATKPGHWETIFDCKFKPHDANIIATASYDGSIKIWDVVSGDLRLEMIGRHGCLYAISWDAASPSSSLLASSAADGTIDIWDTNNGALIRTLQHHCQPCFRLCWNPRNSSQIVSTSSDATAVIFNPHGSVQAVLNHPEAVYGCDFSPFSDNLLATGCHDGIVRLFDLNASVTTPVCELTGHRQRVFNTVWSPLLQHRLASGSDDKTIRVWDTQMQTGLVLEGHHDRVRALVWNPEIPFLLISGSWDATIRVWDIRAGGSCLGVVQDHQSDIYGLATHALRPFLVASSSRDTSLRFWNLDEDVVTRLFLVAAIDQRNGLGRLRNAPENAMSTTAGNRILCGPASQAVQKLLQAPHTTDIAMGGAISELFAFSAATHYLWRLADTIANETPTPDCPILHRSQIQNSLLARAKALEKAVTAPVGRARQRELLLQQADLRLKAGQFLDYCKIMIGLGEWHKAISVAPAISMQFWRDLCQQYADQLGADANPEAVPLWLSIGKQSSAVRFYEQIGDLDSAVAIAICAHPQPMAAEAAESGPGPAEGAAPTDLVEDVVRGRAAALYSSGEAVLAACHHLSLSQVALAVDRLVAGCEFLTAFVLARVLDPTSVQRTSTFVLKMAERLQMWNEIDRVWQIGATPAAARIALCLRYSGDKPLDVFCKEKGVRVPDQAEADTRPDDLCARLRWMIFNLNHNEAVELGLQEIRKMASGSHWSFESCWALVEVLHNVDAVRLSERYRIALLCYCSYFGGIVAKRKGFALVSSKLFENARSLLNAHDWLRVDFPVQDIVIAMQQFRQAPTDALLKTIRNMKASSPETTALIHSAAEAIMKEYESGNGGKQHADAECYLVPSYSQIPSARHSKFPLLSRISGSIIHGVPFPLPDSNDCVERSEAIMWAMVNPFSPGNFGKRLHPF